MERVQKPMQSLFDSTGSESNGPPSGSDGDLGQDPVADAERLKRAVKYVAAMQANSVPLRIVMARYGYQINEQSRKTICPFHAKGRERTASFYWWPDTNRFKCFGCGIKGDVVEFVSLHDNVHRSEAAASIISFHTENIDFSAEARKYVHEDIKSLMDFADGIRVFMQAHRDDPKAISDAESLCETFDGIRADPKNTIKSLKNLVERTLSLLEKY